MKQLNIVIVGGGTGGHITPALAVAEVLRAKHHLSFIGSLGGPEAELIQSAKLPFYPIRAGKLRRYWSWQNFTDLLKTGIGFFQARTILARLKPDVVFAKGGYVSVPVVYAAAFLEIPIVAHESDVVMGLANRLTIDKAELVCTGFPVEVYPKTLRPKLRFTGNPVRSLFFQKPQSLPGVRKKLGFTPTKPIILAMGGSQGALGINQLLWDNLENNLKAFQLVHLTGADHLQRAQEYKACLPAKLQSAYYPISFSTEELPDWLRLADLVITRGSANVLAELALLGKATIIIPLPGSASNHQWANGQAFADKEAAIIIDQDHTQPAQLTAAITRLLKDRAERQRLSRAIRLFQSPEAPTLIAEVIEEIGERPKNR